MAIENKNIRTAMDAQINLGGKNVGASYGSIEANGVFSINFNITDPTWFDNEVEGAKNVIDQFTEFRKLAKAQYVAWKAAQPVAPEPGTEEGEL